MMQSCASGIHLISNLIVCGLLAFCLLLPFVYLLQPSPQELQQTDWLGCPQTSSSVGCPTYSTFIYDHCNITELIGLRSCSGLAFFVFFFFFAAPGARISAFGVCSSSSSLALPEEGCSEASLAVLAASESLMLP